MEKADVLLAALASGNVATYTPADVQRLLFLISRQIADVIDGPPFKFVVCDYGPFDPRVYELLEELEKATFISVNPEGREVTLTPAGTERATETLRQLPEATTDYMRRATSFVVGGSTRILTQLSDRSSAGSSGGRSSRESRLRLEITDPE